MPQPLLESQVSILYLLRRITRMARTGLTKMLADIHETVSSDDECIAHNRRIKSTTSKESKEPKEEKSGGAQIGEVTIRETKKRFDYFLRLY